MCQPEKLLRVGAAKTAAQHFHPIGSCSDTSKTFNPICTRLYCYKVFSAVAFLSIIIRLIAICQIDCTFLALRSSYSSINYLSATVSSVAAAAVASSVGGGLLPFSRFNAFHRRKSIQWKGRNRNVPLASSRWEQYSGTNRNANHVDSNKHANHFTHHHYSISKRQQHRRNQNLYLIPAKRTKKDQNQDLFSYDEENRGEESKANGEEEVKYRNWHKGDSRNISHLLDRLLDGYDSHIRPNFGGPPIEVLIDFHIRSMGPISEVDMTYVVDCYFRQTWTDQRLAYKSSSILESFGTNISADVPISDPYNIKSPKQDGRSQQKALALSINMLDRIWKPPTYFLNSRQSHMHMITLPNKFVRIYSNGRVLYSSRMTIKANCLMNLENFPMDTQRCPLSLGSSLNAAMVIMSLVGYTSSDLIYKWNPNRNVIINPNMKMSQFDLIGVPVHSQNSSLQTSSMLNYYSVLVATFHFKRHMGSFVIEVYAPCIMLVVLSWVGFWINREATADRVTLGLTTVLTMTFLGLELRNDLPKVPYLTALDYFVYISFAFISATILEFGFVHFFTKIGSGEFYFMPIHEISPVTEEEDCDDNQTNFSINERPALLRHRSSSAIYFNRLSRSADSIANHQVHYGAYSKVRRRNRGTSKLNPSLIKRSASYNISKQSIAEYEEDENDQDDLLDSWDSTPMDHQPVVGDRLPSQECRPIEILSLRENTLYYQSGLSALRNSFRNRLLNRQRSVRKQGSRNIHSNVQIQENVPKVSRSIRQLQPNSPRTNSSVRIQLNSVSQIDRVSRLIFPITFIGMNFIYWFIYLRAERNIDQKQLNFN